MENQNTGISAKTIEEKIAEWKRKWGDVFQVDVEGHTCYLHKPDRKTLSAAAVVGGNDPMRYNEIILANCWIEGDEAIKTDDELFLGVAGQLKEIVRIAEASVKKL